MVKKAPSNCMNASDEALLYDLRKTMNAFSFL